LVVDVGLVQQQSFNSAHMSLRSREEEWRAILVHICILSIAVCACIQQVLNHLRMAAKGRS
jgi:hypothetical protein